MHVTCRWHLPMRQLRKARKLQTRIQRGVSKRQLRRLQMRTQSLQVAWQLHKAALKMKSTKSKWSLWTRYTRFSALRPQRGFRHLQLSLRHLLCTSPLSHSTVVQTVVCCPHKAGSRYAAQSAVTAGHALSGVHDAESTSLRGWRSSASPYSHPPTIQAYYVSHHHQPMHARGGSAFQCRPELRPLMTASLARGTALPHAAEPGTLAHCHAHASQPGPPAQVLGASKKLPGVRRAEVLGSGLGSLAGRLVHLCTAKAGQLLRHPVGSSVLLEVAMGGEGGEYRVWG